MGQRHTERDVLVDVGASVDFELGKLLLAVLSHLLACTHMDILISASSIGQCNYSVSDTLGED